MSDGGGGSAERGSPRKPGSGGPGGGLLVLFVLPIVLAIIAIVPQLRALRAPNEPRTANTGEAATGPELAASPRIIEDTACTPLPEPGAQMCWGGGSLGTSGGRLRHFDFKFARKFAGQPRITTSIDVASNGYAFVVYNSETTETGYKGDLIEIQFRGANAARVSMSYMAVGRAGAP